MEELRLKVAPVWKGAFVKGEEYDVSDEVSFLSDNPLAQQEDYVEALNKGELKYGHYRSVKRGNNSPLTDISAWKLVLDLSGVETAIEKIQKENLEIQGAESDRADAESRRRIAENGRKGNESDRADAESRRRIAEGTREGNEKTREGNEKTREGNEKTRKSNEETRKSNEETRKSNEETRKGNEKTREDNEETREDNEETRKDNEETRKSNEETRKDNESDRENAEKDRANAFAAAQQEREEAFEEAEAGRDAKIEEKVEDITRLQGEVAKKANIDGYYSSMAVGAAESLIGQNVTTQQFTYQPTGNTLDVQDGFAVVKSIKGNTIVANQKLDFTDVSPNDCTITPIPNGYRVQSTSAGAYVKLKNTCQFVANHKYYYSLNYYYSGKNNVRILPYRSGEIFSYNYPFDFITCQQQTKIQTIITAKTGGVSDTIMLGYNNAIGEGSYLDVYNYIIIDLTQMFGEGNEPTSVEEFERLYPNLPAECNKGSLLNLNADSIKSVGFNQWDEEWLLGDIDASGQLIAGARITSKNYIPIFPNTQYYYRVIQPTDIASDIFFYDKNKKLIAKSGYFEINSTFTTPENAYYMKFAVSATYGDVYNNDICINLSHSGYRNGEYKPYKESIANLPIKDYFRDGMKSAGEVRDEIIWDEGLKKYKAIQRIGSLLLSDLSFISTADNNFAWGFFAPIPEYYDVHTEDSILWKANAITSLCPVDTTNAVVNQNKDVLCIYRYLNKTYILVKNNKYNYATDLEVFKQSLQGQILYYELETPIETIIDDYDGINYEVSDFGTEEILSNEPTTPIVIDVVYGINAVDTIRRLPQNYISAESMRDFLVQLGSAMNGNWVMTHDEVNNKWVFAFTANEVVNNEEQIEL